MPGRPLVMLFLGHSDTSGAVLEDASLAWPFVIGRELEPLLGRPVNVVHRNFDPSREGGVTFLERLIAEVDPEAVVLGASTFRCAFSTVALHVERRYGQRALRLYRWFERNFDRASGGPGPEPGRVNRLARRVGRRVIGTESDLTVGEVVERHRALISRLAREESRAVIVIGGFRTGARHQRNDAGLGRRCDMATVAIRRDAEQHRFAWLSHETPLAGPDRESLMFADGLHRTVEGHRRTAAALLPEFARVLGRARVEA